MTTYRDEHGRFRKRTAEDAKREYEAMSPWQKILHDQAREQARRVAKTIVDGNPLLSALRRTPNEQGDMRSLHMNRTSNHRVFLAPGQVAVPWPTPPGRDVLHEAMRQRQDKIVDLVLKPVESIGIRKGDVFTIPHRDPWWHRALIWLRIIKPKPLRKFVVTDSGSNTIVGIEGQ